MSTYTFGDSGPQVGAVINENFRPIGGAPPSELAGGGTRSGKRPCSDGTVKDSIKDMLGDSVSFANVMSSDLDLKAGYPHAM